MNALPIVVALVFLAQITAAPALAGPRDLNDPARAVEREDVAPIKKAKKIPYETIEKENFSVSYNLQVRDDGLGPVYRLSLIMRNNTGEGVRIEPKLTLLDRDGLAIRPKSYEAVRSEAFALAGVASAPLPVSTRGGSRYSEGTITNTTTGERHSYTARSSTTGNFSDSFATGYAIGAQARARRNMDDAFTLVT